jgi:hypothetical protein
MTTAAAILLPPSLAAEAGDGGTMAVVTAVAMAAVTAVAMAAVAVTATCAPEVVVGGGSRILGQ